MDYRLRQDAEKKLEQEIGAIRKVSGQNISVVLVYPNTYYLGMSNLGFQTIYGGFNARDDVRCERAFLPDQDVFPIYEQTKTPIFSLESKIPLAEFDIIAFSVSYENDYLNILKILALSQLPLKAEDRQDDDPLIILGGAITTINPEPLAMFIDLFVIGDGEEIISQCIATYQRHKETSKSAMLREMAENIPGIYVPAFYMATYDNYGHVQRYIPQGNVPEKISAGMLRDLDAHPTYSRILTEQTEFGNMFLVQVSRGCPYRCRFCHTGYTQCQLRHLSLDTAIRLIEQGLQFRDTIGLVSSAIADYPDLKALYQAIASRGGKFSISSLRITALGKADYLLDTMAQTGQKTVTVAPETGTERLRKLIRKGLSDDLFYTTIERVFSRAIPNLKLYFLIGLPTETDDDIEAIIALCKRCKHLMLQTAHSFGKIGKMTVSVNPFIPKPFTPLQWCAMASESDIQRKIQRIKHALHRLGNVEVIYDLPKWAVWQGILARGDRKIGDVLLLALQYQGDWKKAFRELNMHPDFYAHRRRGFTEEFPWDHLNIGLSQQQLRDEYLSFPMGDGMKG